MNSNILKNAILHHFRFKRGFYLCATEVRLHGQTSDIMLCNDDNEIIDIEIKISYSDFLADFKKLKHKKIKGTPGFPYLYANKLYFCIPADLKKKCLEYLDNNKLPYGLITFNGYLTIIKKCKMNNYIFSNQEKIIKRKILLRLSSEMVFLRNNQKCENCGHINKPDLIGKVFV
jgi:hypothetical protein